MRWFLGPLLAACLLAGVAQAQMLQGIVGDSNEGTNGTATTCGISSGYVGPVDCIVAGGFTATVCQSMRACSHAIAVAGTQAMYRLQRSSDNHKCDILPASTGGPGLTGGCDNGGDNGTLWSTWCTASGGSCNDGSTNSGGLVWYDQLNGHDGLAYMNDPVLFNPSCGGTQCFNSTFGLEYFETVSSFTPNGVESYVFVESRYVPGTSYDLAFPIGIIDHTTSPLSTVVGNFGAANSLALNDHAGNFLSSTHFTDNSLHAVVGIFNGANSKIYVDNLGPDTNTMTPTTVAAPILTCDDATAPSTGTSLYCWENILIDGQALDAPTVAAIHTNEKNYFGSP